MKRTPFNAFMKAQVKRRIRNKRFLVWVVIMPIILMGSLHLIWEGQGVQPHIVVFNQDDSNMSVVALGILKSQEDLEVHEVFSLETGIDELRKGDAEAFVVIPRDFGAKWDQIGEDDFESIVFDVYYTAGEQEEKLINLILKGVVEDINRFVEGDKQRPVEINSRRLSLNGGATSDMLLPAGIIIINVHIGVYASSTDISRVKEHNLCKKIKVGPKDPIHPLMGMIIIDSVFTTVASMIALISGMVLFDLSISYIALLGSILLFFLSSILFSMIGHVIGKHSDAQTSAQSIASMVIFPLIFFSQAFLFSSIFPRYVSNIATYLPTYPLTEGMRQLYFYQISILGFMSLLFICALWLLLFFLISYHLENKRR